VTSATADVDGGALNPAGLGQQSVGLAPATTRQPAKATPLAGAEAALSEKARAAADFFF
jgi:hypothetical protein